MNAAPAKLDWNRPTSVPGLSSFVTDQLKGEINAAVPVFLRGHATRLVRCMLSECSMTPSLLDCTPASLFGGVIRAAQLGLTIGGPTGESYLIPFSSGKKGVKEASLIIGYRGYLQLGHRSGMVRRITPRVVREGDQFYIRFGSSQAILHEPVRNNTGEVTDYYVILETVTGGVDFETATREEMTQHRDRYAMSRKAPDFVRAKSPWYSNGPEFDQMCLKTLIRRLAKRMPLSVELTQAVGLDEQAEQGVPQRLAAATAELVPPSAGGPEVPSVEDDLRERLNEYTPGVDDPGVDPEGK